MTLVAMLFLLLGGAFAQTKVNGTVVSQDDGQPVIGASVMVVGTQVGTVTNADGRFSLTCPAGKNVLRITYVGMEPLEVTARPNMRILLTSDSKALDEVIVVAYGTAKRSAFTGSATQIKADVIDDHVTSNVMNALAGSTPGVQLTSSNGDPNDNAPAIRIRGIGSMYASNTPLYIVDGMPYDGPVNAINPADIESMTVLKDAAASAIYGARGANGVVILTTKKGRNQDADIKLDAKWGVNSRLIPQYDVITDPGQYYETAYKQLYNSQIYSGKTSAQAYAFADANLYNQANGGLGYLVYTVPAGEKLIGTNFKLNPRATLGYSDGEYYYTPDDWYDETFHSSLRQEYNLSVSGVQDRLNYYASAGYLKDEGIVNNSQLQRYTARINADYQAKKWLKIAANMGFTHTDSDSPSYDTEGNMSSGNIFYITNNMGPIYPLYVRDAQGNIMYENGRMVYDSNQTNQKRPSVVGNAVRDNEVNVTKTYRDLFNGKFSAIFTPIEGLTLSANLSVYAGNLRTNYLSSQFGSSSASDGFAQVYHERDFAVTNQYLANYRKTIASYHNIELLAGYEQYKRKYQYLSGSNDHLYDPLIGELTNALGSANKRTRSYTNEYMTEGFLSRLQYDYKERYFFSASFRRDASSRFHKDHRWGNFGSVGLAWEIANESFMKDTRSWLDMLKLKVSYGTQGNDNLNFYTSYYPYADLYETSYNSESDSYSLVLYHKGNDDLTWESSKNFNAGVDFSLFHNRLSGSIEYFYRETSDMLYYKDTPLSAGIVTGVVPVNIGSVANSGVEFSLNANVLRLKDLTWDVNLNLSHYKNEIKELDPSVSQYGIKGSYRIYKVGGSLYETYLRKFAGVDPKTGKGLYYREIKYDENGKELAASVNEYDHSEVVTTDDFSKATQFECGSTLPDLFGGFGTSVRYRDFDLSAQLTFQLGGKMYDGTYQQLMHTNSSQGPGSAWHKDILNAWTPDNTDTDIPRMDGLSSGEFAIGQTAVDRFLISSDYLSINNVTLGYTLPKSLLGKVGINSLRVYVAGENLAVFTKRKGLDPRYSLGIGGYIGGSGASSTMYSALRTITGGITLSF